MIAYRQSPIEQTLLVLPLAWAGAVAVSLSACAAGKPELTAGDVWHAIRAQAQQVQWGTARFSVRTQTAPEDAKMIEARLADFRAWLRDTLRGHAQMDIDAAVERNALRNAGGHVSVFSCVYAFAPRGRFRLRTFSSYQDTESGVQTRLTTVYSDGVYAVCDDEKVSAVRLYRLRGRNTVPRYAIRGKTLIERLLDPTLILVGCSVRRLDRRATVPEEGSLADKIDVAWRGCTVSVFASPALGFAPVRIEFRDRLGRMIGLRTLHGHRQVSNGLWLPSVFNDSYFEIGPQGRARRVYGESVVLEQFDAVCPDLSSNLGDILPEGKDIMDCRFSPFRMIYRSDVAAMDRLRREFTDYH